MALSRKSKSGRKYLNGVLLFLSTLLIAFLIYLSTRKKGISSLFNSNSALFSRGSVAFSVAGGKYNKVDYRKWIEAISKHETANYTSKLYKDANNLFGMGMPSVRPTLATPAGVQIENQEMARYPSKSDSVKDFLLWLNYQNCPVDFVSPDELIQFMKDKSYFTESFENYLKGVESWIQ